MRKIKFRAKTDVNIEEVEHIKIEHDGNWVFGTYLDGFIVDGVVEATDEYIALECWCPIDIDTVGQYTGLKDKNGVEIYEGDILKRTSTIKQRERELFDEIIGQVTIKIGMTYLVGKRKHGYLDEELKISNYKALLLSPDLFEVIGDIHNNPELIESEE